MTRKEVRCAIRRGELVPHTVCEQCGKSATKNGRTLDAHHHNGYSLEHILDVQWLCRSCHSKLHSTPASHANRSPSRRIAIARLGVTAMLVKTTPQQRVERARIAGRAGGVARANSLTAERRSEIARIAGLRSHG